MNKIMKMKSMKLIESFSFRQNLKIFSKTKDDFLEILFYDRYQIDHKIAWGLGGRFLNIH